ncbi:hypothetical protein FXO37_11773 [Capsicum annuum]|nr:hypothetical protein FXO37_11773 [Capsicum annuum]
MALYRGREDRRDELVASFHPYPNSTSFTNSPMGFTGLQTRIRDIDLCAQSCFVTCDYVLVVTYRTYYSDNCLAFWRHGDLNWTKIDTHGQADTIVTAMNYFKDQFYYVTGYSEVCVVEGTRHRLLFRLGSDMRSQESMFYLVDLSGVLLLVTRFDHHNSYGQYETFKFKVFELDVIKGALKRKIKSLGNSAIFLGRNSPSSIDTSKSTGVKA